MGTTNFDIVEANRFKGDIEIKNIIGDVTGNLTGNVTGNLTGNVTGNLTGNVTGNLTGKIVGTAIDTADATAEGSSQTVDPTEFAAVVTLLNACKEKINALIQEEEE